MCPRGVGGSWSTGKRCGRVGDLELEWHVVFCAVWSRGFAARASGSCGCSRMHDEPLEEVAMTATVPSTALGPD